MKKYWKRLKYKINYKLTQYIPVLIGLAAVFAYYIIKKNNVSEKQILTIVAIICAALLIFVICRKVIGKHLRRKRYLNSPLYAIDHMSGTQFEHYLKAHFEKLGYRVKLTPDSHDYGADLVCKKDHETIVIQAKRYNEKVSIQAIQQIVAAKPYYGATKAMVITNSFFTSSAINLAEVNEVELWDRNTINKKLVIKNTKNNSTK